MIRSNMRGNGLYFHCPASPIPSFLTRLSPSDGDGDGHDGRPIGIGDLSSASNLNDLPGVFHSYRLSTAPVFDSYSETSSNTSTYNPTHKCLSSSGKSRRNYPLMKCPCCKRACRSEEFFCPACLSSTIFRLGKLREKRRFLVEHKSELSQRMEDQLREKMEHDDRRSKRQHSIDTHRLDIASKHAKIGQLRKRIEQMELVNGKSRKNVALLERKTTEHLERIRRTQRENQYHRGMLYRCEEKRSRAIQTISGLLLEIFPVSAVEQKSTESIGRGHAWTTSRSATGAKQQTCYRVCNCVVSDSPIVHPDSLPSNPYNNASLELCAQQSAALIYVGKLVESFASLLHTFLPYRELIRELMFSAEDAVEDSDEATNTSSFGSNLLLFKLEYVTVRLALALDVPSERVAIGTPLTNLHTITLKLQHGTTTGGHRPHLPRPIVMESKLRSQVQMERYRRTRTGTDDGSQETALNCTAEEDWVNVDFAP